MTLVGHIISVLLFYAVVVCAQGGNVTSENSLTITGTTNAKYGTNVTLNCSFISDDANTIWTTTATSNDELEYTDSDTSSILTITHVTLDHMGNYTCTSNDTGAITEATVTLTVYVPAPVVTTPLTDVLVDYNDDITLTCTFQSLTTPNVMWSTDAMNRVLPNPTLSSSSSSHTSVLMLNNVTLDNEGLYTCTATNEGGMNQSSGSVDILVPIPSVTIDPPNPAVPVYSNITLTCTVSSLTDVNITWSYNNMIIKEDSTYRGSGVFISTLNLLQLNLNDSGLYICRATNRNGSAEITSNIIVYSKPEVIIYGNSSVQITQSTMLMCTVISLVVPNITWSTMGNTLMANQTSINSTTYVAILKLDEVDLDVTGTYTCTATNGGGITAVDFNLTVFVPAPVVTTPLTDVMVDHNGNITLTCTFQSLTIPNVMWSTNATNQVLPNPTLSSSSISHTSVLMLNNITLDNEGFYTCTATNEGGMIQSTARVDILVPIPSVTIDPPNPAVPIYSNITLTCTVSSLTDVNVTWSYNNMIIKEDSYQGGSDNMFTSTLDLFLLNLNDSGLYICQATNRNGVANITSNITVYIPQPEVIIYGNSSVQYTDSTMLMCTVISLVVPTSITWSTMGNTLMTNQTSINDTTYVAILKLDEVDLNDAGTYTCTATNDGGTSAVDFDLTVFVPPPTIESPLIGQNVSVSKTINLTCKADGFDLTYLWTIPMSARSDLYTASGVDTPNLVVYPASTNTDGIYTCKVTDFVNNSVSESIRIIANNIELISSNSSNGIIDVLQGEYELLQCVFQSPPDVVDQVIVKWASDGVDIAPNGTTSVRHPQANNDKYSSSLDITTDRGADYTIISTLRFNPVNWFDFTDNDFTSFYCYGFVEGHDNSKVDGNVVVLRPLYPPIILFRPSPVNRFQFEYEVHVECGVISSPDANASISKIYPNGSVVVLSKQSNLKILNSTFEDAGNYKCSFDNYLGSKSANFTVIIEDVPDQVLLPINVVLLSFFDARLSWEAPFNNFAETQNYMIYYHQGTLDFVNFTRSNSNVPQIVISNLAPNVNYTFSVESCNPRGCGERSPEIIFPSISREMASLQNVRIPFPLINSTSFFISWHIPLLATNPLDNARAAVIESITITYQSNNALDNNGGTIALSSEEALKLNYTVGGLGSSATYVIELIISYERPSLMGNPFHYIIETRDGNNLPADSPLVDDKSIDDKDNPVIAVSWTPLTVQNGRDLLQNYIVRVGIVDLSTTNRNKRQTSSTRNFNISRDQSSFNFTEISPFFSYTIDVLAQLIVNGESLEPIPITQPFITTSSQAAPSAPSNFRFTRRNFTNVRVEWDLPAFPNGIILGYIFTGDSIEPLPDPILERYRDISDLTGYTNYTFSVAAVTGGGTGPPAVIHNFTLSGVAPINRPEIIMSTGSINSFNVYIAKFSQNYGPTGLFKLIVMTNTDYTGPFPEHTLHSYTDSRWRAYGYYVAVIHNTMGNTTITVGDGGSYTVGAESYINYPLESGNPYRVFIRVYSALMEDADMQYRDSGFSTIIELPQDTTVFIIIPIFLFLILLLIIIIVIIILVIMFKKKSPQRTETYYLDEITKTELSMKTGSNNRHPSNSSSNAKSNNNADLNSTGLYAPTLTIQSTEVFTSIGSPTVLLCEAGGTPTPELTWSKSGASLEEPDYIKLSNGSLHIANTRLRDQGHFVVRATNAGGTVEEVIRVVVLAPSPPESDPGHPPLSVSDYIERMALIHSSNSDVLEEEYRDIELEWNFTSYAAKLPINHSKNRYVNIIPYDHSRVPMSLQDNIPGSDYINASYIDGLNTPNAFIATQGPIPTAFADFWRMIWELNVPTIVMVTNLKEDEKIKCHQYWPSYGVANYGNVQVTLKEFETIADYAIRTFQIQNLQGRGANQVKEVRQYHFLVWPDHGVPQYATPLLSFRKRIRKYHESKNGPMVVHCSAGVGRTGTFITIDTMIMKIDTEGIVDIFNFVRSMRFRRNYMVQTASQYEFLHDAILEAIMCRDTTISSTDLAKKITALQEINPSNGLTGFQSQFETLESSSPSDEDFDCSVAQLPDNIKKSRSKENLPPNDFRVVLSTNDNDPDYICASYVDGYRQRKAFIATQGPLKTTAGDFWRMVWETKSSTIIMLTKLIEDGEEQSVQYWPTSSSDEGIYGKFQVELLPEERNLPDYVVRKFKLSPVNIPHEIRTVTHFHYMSWPSSSVPPTATAMNDLIEDVVRVQRKSGNGPITVHCSDGLGRTGTFCAMFTVLERLKAEKVVDVFSTIKSLRTQRPGLLNTLEQYKFIHQAALEFVNNFENYDNFK